MHVQFGSRGLIERAYPFPLFCFRDQQIDVSRKGLMEYHAEMSSMSQQEQGEKRRGGTQDGA